MKYKILFIIFITSLILISFISCQRELSNTNNVKIIKEKDPVVKVLEEKDSINVIKDKTK